MPRRASLRAEGGQGLEALFKKRQIDSKQASQKDVQMGETKVKVTFHLHEDIALLLEELKLKLRREYSLPSSQASKSSIVEAALKLQAENLETLAEALREKAV